MVAENQAKESDKLTPFIGTGLPQDTDTFTYGWLSGADLLNGYHSSQTSPLVSVDYAYENNRDLVSRVANKSMGVSKSQYDYVYDEAGRRMQRTDSPGTANKFLYNARSEVVGADMDGNSVYEDSYAYDAIGNRSSRVENGSSLSYTPNNLNQYSWVGSTSYAYDADGNLTDDGTWSYQWDGENRLVTMERKVKVANSPRVVFKYDYMGRRYQKDVFRYDTSTASFPSTPASTTTFIYDGWNLIQQVSGQTSKTFVWGLDLSQTLQGAGGVGGLLAQCEISNNPSEITVFYAVADANGNITAYVNTLGAIKGSIEYDSFGQHVATAGDIGYFPFRFSSKYYDGETGMYYYGHRYYSPVLGRWLSRDPIGERGGFNLYGFVGNRSINHIDIYGLETLQKEVEILVSKGGNSHGYNPGGYIPPSDYEDSYWTVIVSVEVACGKDDDGGKFVDFQGREAKIDFWSRSGLHAANSFIPAVFSGGMIDVDYTANVNRTNTKPTKKKACPDGTRGDIKEITLTVEIIANIESAFNILGLFDVSFSMFNPTIATEEVIFKYSCCCEEGEVK